MATCPDCGRKDAMTLDETGTTVFVADPPGTFSLAGVQPKMAARRVEVLVLQCDPDPHHGAGCGWSAQVYVDGDQLVTLTAAPAP